VAETAAVRDVSSRRLNSWAPQRRRPVHAGVRKCNSLARSGGRFDRSGALILSTWRGVRTEPKRFAAIGSPLVP